LLNIRHTGIVVTDPDRSIQFYTNHLGFKMKLDMIESGKYIDNFTNLENVEVRTMKMSLENGDMIELLWFKTHQEIPSGGQSLTNVGCSHLALTVENLEDTYKKLGSAGVLFTSPPQISPNGFAKVAFCADPDGTLIELVEEL
jgi:catechol 2,3-dioxygenase-like lactoylglutathione lyase family enzyme